MPQALPARNILDGTALPSTSTMKTALGQLRDYLAETLGVTGGVFSSSLRNRLINPNMDVWQRGTSFTNLAANGFFADRWQFGWDGTGVLSTISRQPVINPANGYLQSNYVARISITNAGISNTFKNIYQKIEGGNTLQGKTITFTARFSPSTSLANVSLDVIQYFGTGGSPSASVQTSSATLQTIAAGGVYSWSLTVPSVAGKTFGTNGDDSLWLIIGLPAAGTYLVDIGECQLEIGSTATTFEQRPIGIELALCQRYAYSLPIGAIYARYGATAATQYYSASHSFPVTMRVAPTVTTVPGFSYTNAAAATFQISSVNFIAYAAHSSASGDSFFNNSSAALLTAEL